MTELSGSELAWRALKLGVFGVDLRTIDHCAGSLRVKDLTISPAGVTARPATTRSEARGEASRAETHGRSGHDAGCASLGLPLSLVDRALAQWDESGASGLLIEAMHEAVGDILEDTRRGGGWRQSYARESLSYAIERRITPRAETATSHDSGAALNREIHCGPAGSASRSERFRPAVSRWD